MQGYKEYTKRRARQGNVGGVVEEEGGVTHHRRRLPDGTERDELTHEHALVLLRRRAHRGWREDVRLVLLQPRRLAVQVHLGSDSQATCEEKEGKRWTHK